MTSPDPRTIRRRLESLERRIAALEAPARTARTRAARAPEAPAPDAQWVLQGLRRRAAPRPARGRAGGRVAFAGIVYAGGGEHYEWIGERELAPLLDEPWTPWAPAFSALRHPVRLEILRALAHGRYDVTELGRIPGMGTTGQLYHHLRELQAVGWVRLEKRNHYVIVPDRMVALAILIAAAAGRHPPEPPHAGRRRRERRPTE